MMQQAAPVASSSSSAAAERQARGSESSSSVSTSAELHGQYRMLIDATIQARESLSNPVDEEFGRVLPESQKLFDDVKSTSEAALDSYLTSLFATINKSRILHINTAPKGFDTDSFIRVLCERLGLADGGARPAPEESPSLEAARGEAARVKQQRKWADLGRMVTGSWKSVTGLDVMYGPMFPGPDAVHDLEQRGGLAGQGPQQQQQQQQQQSQRVRNKNSDPLEKSFATDAADVAPEGQAKTGRLVDQVITSLSRATEDGPVEFWKFVINPESFGQSVENLFYVSFLIKDGQAALEMHGGSARPPTDDDFKSGHAQRKQCIATMSISMFEELKQKYPGPPMIDRSALVQSQDSQPSERDSQQSSASQPPRKKLRHH